MVKQKQLEIMETIQSTTTLADSNILQNEPSTPSPSLIQEKNGENLFKVVKVSSKILSDDLTNGKKTHKKQTGSPILSASPSSDSIDMSDNDDHSIRINQNIASTVPTSTSAQSLPPTLSPNSNLQRPISPRQQHKTKVCFNPTITLSPNPNSYNFNNNDTVNSNSSLKGHVIYLNKPEIPQSSTTILTKSSQQHSMPYNEPDSVNSNKEEENSEHHHQNMNSQFVNEIDYDFNDECNQLIDDSSNFYFKHHFFFTNSHCFKLLALKKLKMEVRKKTPN
jgi:hypothetical protein